MQKTLQAITVACGLLISPLIFAEAISTNELSSSNNDWRLLRYDRLRDISVYGKNEESKRIRSFKVEALFDHPIDDVTRLQADVENYVRWYFAVKESKILKESDSEFIFYMVHSTPVSLPERDVIIRAQISPMTAQQPYVLVRMRALPNYLPLNPNYVRMPAEDYTIKFTPVGNNQTKLESEGYIDLGGNSPMWALNFMQWRIPYANMLGMMRMLQTSRYKDKEDKALNSFHFFDDASLHKINND